MKRFLLVLCVALSVPTFNGCATAPSARVVQVQSLKAVGHTAEAALASSAQLYQAGTITAAQARAVIDFYNAKFLPPFRIAVAAVGANLESIASTELADLAAQLSALVLQFAKGTP